ncbi:MAG: DUF6531 domain-containing protein [Pseudomonadota bacterium]|nr:DUF6531 domain-containing protein [Pseudomonadota bacterium]
MGISGTYYAYFVDVSNPYGTISQAYSLGALCTDAGYFVAVPQESPPAVADLGSSCPTCQNGPDPVNPSSGSEFLDETDISPIGTQRALFFNRYYNSLDTISRDTGPGWRHSFNRQLTLEYSYPPAPPPAAGDSSLYATQAAACTSGWAQIQSQSPASLQGATASFSGGTCTLTINGSAAMTLIVYDNRGEYIAVDRTVTAVHAQCDDGHILNFAFNGSAFSAEPGMDAQLASTTSGGYQLIDNQDNVETYDSSGKLLSIADRAGNTQTLSYGSASLSSVTDNFGHTLAFAYDGSNRLQTVTAPDGTSVTYGYDEAGHLSNVTNVDGSLRQYIYSDSNWATGISSVVDESSQTEFALSYDTQGRVVSSTLGGVSSSMYFVYHSDGSTTETDPLTATRTFLFQQVGDHELSSAVTGDPCKPCGYAASLTYDSGGFPASNTDFDGNITNYVYDDVRGLEVLRTEANGAAVARTITTQWSSDWREPTLITEPNRTTAFSYDLMGNMLTKTITDTTVTPNVARTWTYSYDGYGRVLTARDPRSDVSSTTRYAYYTCTTGYQCGEVQTITNALGQVTTFNTYNAHGQPLTITDANGVVTRLTYDARQRVTSRQVGTETTSYAYYPTGLLQTVTLPDGGTIGYTYDAAHRLIKIADRAGNYVSYTLDALGNRTAESAYDPSGVFSRTHSRVFNALSELYQDIGASGSTTTLGYDNNGNVISSAAPLSLTTGTQYDALNRLTQITDPASGVTQVSYDANGNVARVTDPTMLSTSYTHNGFGEVVQQVSPASGTTMNTYDSAGNLATSTDARGAVATYGYDALNRVSSVAYQIGGVTDQTISFTYDAGSNGVGRLTGASDANHALAWSYDALGRVTGKGQTVSGLTLSIGYGYTNGDVTSMTTPSGQTVIYTYADHQVTGITVNSGVLLTSAAYEPFGPVRGWIWGSGTTEVRLHDTDGNLSQLSGIESTTLSYDAAYRISGVTNSTNTALSWTYGYDSLDRVSSAAQTGTTLGWTYDADGNRLQQTGASAGNGLLGATFTYNARGRMSAGGLGGNSASYVYNALGQMVQKIGATTTTLVYDEAGHLVGEYSGSGALIQETVWLGDLPVATLRPNGSGGISLYYIHADQLNAPRTITRPVDNAIVWRWDTDPFGTTQPNQNPSGLGSFTYNLRFPGQYAQTETGLIYNYFRDYDAASGRYVESDPLGLFGGSYSPYVYANSNPLMYIDPFGLCWVYSQSTGQLTHVDDNGNVDYTANGGYSGYGAGVNNPVMESVQAVHHGDPAGPIPSGYYSIGLPFHSARTGPGAMRLTPVGGINPYGRRDLEIHGDKAPYNHTASTGCIIEGPAVRQKIAKGLDQDNCLQVVP